MYNNGPPFYHIGQLCFFATLIVATSPNVLGTHGQPELYPQHCNEGTFSVNVIPDDSDNNKISSNFPQINLTPDQMDEVANRVTYHAEIRPAAPLMGGYIMIPLHVRTRLTRATLSAEERGSRRRTRDGTTYVIVLEQNTGKVVAAEAFAGRLWGPHMTKSGTIGIVKTTRDTSHMWGSNSSVILWDIRKGKIDNIFVHGGHHDMQYNAATGSILTIQQDKIPFHCTASEGGPENPPLDIPDEVFKMKCIGIRSASRMASMSADRIRRRKMLRGGETPGRTENEDDLALPRMAGMGSSRNLLYDNLREYDLQGEKLWEFDMKSEVLQGKSAAAKHKQSITPTHVSPTPRLGVGGGPARDPSKAQQPNVHTITMDAIHGNTVYWDWDRDVIYYNSRHMDTLLKIDHKTKKHLWTVGRFGTWPTYNLKGEKILSPFYGAHGTKYIGYDKDGRERFIAFDNDLSNMDTCLRKRTEMDKQQDGAAAVDEEEDPAAAAEGLGNPRARALRRRSMRDRACGSIHRTRLVEFAVDETNKRVDETWEWIPENTSYIRTVGGGLIQLPNGNIFASFGRDSRHFLVEIKREIPEPLFNLNTQSSFMYYASRFLDRPGIRVTKCVTQDTTEFEVAVWNAFLEQGASKGTLLVTSDCVCADNSMRLHKHIDFEFNAHWQETPLTFDTEQAWGKVRIMVQNAESLTGTLLVDRPCGC